MSTGMLLMTAALLIALLAGFYLVDARAQDREQDLGKLVGKIKGGLNNVEAQLVKVHGIVKALPMEGLESRIGGLSDDLNVVRQEIEKIKTLATGELNDW